MGFAVNRLIQETADGSVQFPDGSVLKFRYRPYAYTPDHEDAVDLAREDARAGTTLKAMLIPLLAWWDVIEEEEVDQLQADGTTARAVRQTEVPIDEKGLGMVPIKALNMIMSEIIDDMSPGKTKSETSEGSFG